MVANERKGGSSFLDGVVKSRLGRPLYLVLLSLAAAAIACEEPAKPVENYVNWSSGKQVLDTETRQAYQGSVSHQLACTNPGTTSPIYIDRVVDNSVGLILTDADLVKDEAECAWRIASPSGEFYGRWFKAKVNNTGFSIDGLVKPDSSTNGLDSLKSEAGGERIGDYAFVHNKGDFGGSDIWNASRAIRYVVLNKGSIEGTGGSGYVVSDPDFTLLADFLTDAKARMKENISGYTSGKIANPTDADFIEVPASQENIDAYMNTRSPDTPTFVVGFQSDRPDFGIAAAYIVDPTSGHTYYGSLLISDQLKHTQFFERGFARDLAEIFDGIGMDSLNENVINNDGTPNDLMKYIARAYERPPNTWVDDSSGEFVEKDGRFFAMPQSQAMELANSLSPGERIKYSPDKEIYVKKLENGHIQFEFYTPLSECVGAPAK